MNSKTFEEVRVLKDNIDVKDLLLEGVDVIVQKYNNKPFGNIS